MAAYYIAWHNKKYFILVVSKLNGISENRKSCLSFTLSHFSHHLEFINSNTSCFHASLKSKHANNPIATDSSSPCRSPTKFSKFVSKIFLPQFEGTLWGMPTIFQCIFMHKRMRIVGILTAHTKRERETIREFVFMSNALDHWVM